MRTQAIWERKRNRVDQNGGVCSLPAPAWVIAARQRALSAQSGDSPVPARGRGTAADSTTLQRQTGATGGPGADLRAEVRLDCVLCVCVSACGRK